MASSVLNKVFAFSLPKITFFFEKLKHGKCVVYSTNSLRRDFDSERYNLYAFCCNHKTVRSVNDNSSYPLSKDTSLN